MKTAHTLRTTVGVVIEMTFDESDASFVCQWSHRPPFAPSTRDAIIAEYVPWRDDIIRGWGARTGRRVAILSV